MENNNLMPEVYYASFTLRLRAMLLDCFLLVSIFGLIMVILTNFPGIPGWARSSLLISPLLIEPILLVLCGGSIAHLLLGMRVCDSQSYQNLGLVRILIRSFLKATFGLLSFIFLAFSKNNQAIHDWGARSIVIVPNSHKLSNLKVRGLASLVTPLETEKRISIWNKVVAILLGILVSFVLFVAAMIIFLSSDCMLKDECTPKDFFLQKVLGLTWEAIAVLIIILGIKGRLYGIRSNKA